ncbi:hypothetical protein TTHERM_001049258 (macronuclear) [Tetrahymena thermophila SB210]|uniref:Uncharacterized protein n=1 Tax=Tetrahymena thermophila (strain SB210) TaxID=312017 RepID=W7XCP2_TETTS|nr:hypothetical protein TTHERM_001049258 [Tetrahymena thermophila SB210]EWS71556.1 hypothetical protein TTHERM_001049258 [Tetrahymena thermophila SB210]|eukprot:XP_012655901.1 hypothetical protein TTHERM_001049258 [Tetrahymena thermophila SB210]
MKSSAQYRLANLMGLTDSFKKEQVSCSKICQKIFIQVVFCKLKIC